LCDNANSLIFGKGLFDFGLFGLFGIADLQHLVSSVGIEASVAFASHVADLEVARRHIWRNTNG